jgi:hypothetical protein
VSARSIGKIYHRDLLDRKGKPRRLKLNMLY